MPNLIPRSGFLSLLFILKDTKIQELIEQIYRVHDMNEHNIGNITFCLNAEEGLNEFKFNFPDMIFIQTELTDRSGYNLLDTIHKSDKDAYIVMIGSDSSVTNIKKALAQGAKGFIVQPFSPNSINEYIVRFFKERFSKDSHGYSDEGET